MEKQGIRKDRGSFIEEGRNGKKGEDREMEKKEVDTSWGRYLPYLG